MLDLTIDENELLELGKRLGATEAQIIHARNMAIIETQKQVAADVRKRVGQGRVIGRVPLIRSRVRTGEASHHGPDELRVWLGAGAVYAMALGEPRAYGKPGRSGGVKVGKIDMPGAFLAKVYKRSKGSVWMRLRSRHLDLVRYAYRHRRRGDRGGQNSRFPVVSLMLRVDEEIARIAAAAGAEVAPAYKLAFSKRLREMLFQGGAS